MSRHEARLSIHNFAQISEVNLTFGDLTVLVGAQGTGKSLALQWLKTAMDGKQIISALQDAGQSVIKPEALIDLIFGVGMAGAWRADSRVEFNDTSVRPKSIRMLGNGTESVFFIPAQKAHKPYFAEEVRTSFADSLDIDKALRKGNDQANRWDYLLGHSGSSTLIGLEPHSAKEDRISTVIAKKSAAGRQLAEHLGAGARIKQWLWVASGPVHFANTERARVRLDQNGIKFVGKVVLPKHLPTAKSSNKT